MNRTQHIALLFVAACGVTPLAAQEQLPRKVENVEIVSLEGTPSRLPHFGEKNLMIFYVDPDHPKQGESFTDDLERTRRAQSKNIYGLGIMNLKDAPFVPNGMARSIARKRTEINHAVILADQERTLSTAWGLGDCNNQFVLLFVSKEGELVYMHKGEMSAADTEEFYRIVDRYR